MNTILPEITTVADLQRSYRPIITRLKKSGKPLIVVSNGKPDVVIMDIRSYESREKAFLNIEESYLLTLANQARRESKKKKTIVPKADQTLLDVLDSDAN